MSDATVVVPAAPRPCRHRVWLFRFLFAYALIWTFPTPLAAIPSTLKWLAERDCLAKSKPALDHVLVPLLEKSKVVADAWERWSDVAVRWSDAHVLHAGVTVGPLGSGDTTWNYVQLLLWVVAALVVSLLWLAVDWRRTHHARLGALLRIWLRYVVGTALVSYGAAKVIPSQMPTPNLAELVGRFGDASPMGVLWRMIGLSSGYSVFGGLAELVPGVLLFFRRTATLGALLGAATLANVVALNFCYDVPVKLYSSHLFLMALVVAAPDLRKLFDLFVRHTPSPPLAGGPLFSRRWANLTFAPLHLLLVGGFCSAEFAGDWQARMKWGDGAPRSPWRGVWNVAEFEQDGLPRPPLLTDAERWRAVIFDSAAIVAIERMDASQQWFELAHEPESHTLKLSTLREPKQVFSLAYSDPQEGAMTLEGVVDGHRLRAKLELDAKGFLALDRGFHWVNETPLNR